MDVRPSENEPSPLRPGDILLFHGHGFQSWAIRRFEESDVDHAAIVLEPETMAEVSSSGLRNAEIEPAVEGNASPTFAGLPARSTLHRSSARLSHRHRQATRTCTIESYSWPCSA